MEIRFATWACCLFLCSVPSFAAEQDKDAKKEENPPTNKEIFDHFSVGTLFGMAPDVAQLRKLLGPDTLSTRNSFIANAPASRFTGNDSYEYKVGLDNDGYVAWVSATKKGFGGVLSIGPQEAIGLLRKTADGQGDWKMDSAAADKEKEDGKDKDAKREKPPYVGTLWQYSSDFKGVIRHLQAYLPPDNRYILIFTSKVSPPLNGTSRIGGTSLVFNDGDEIPWTLASAGDAGEAGEVIYIDSPTPADLKAALAAGDSDKIEARMSQAYAESILQNTSRSLARNDYLALKDSRALVALANKGVDVSLFKGSLTLQSKQVQSILNQDTKKEEIMKKLESLQNNLKEMKSAPGLMDH